MLPLQGPWVRFLDKELRFHSLHSAVKIKKERKGMLSEWLLLCLPQVHIYGLLNPRGGGRGSLYPSLYPFLTPVWAQAPSTHHVKPACTKSEEKSSLRCCDRTRCGQIPNDSWSPDPPGSLFLTRLIRVWLCGRTSIICNSKSNNGFAETIYCFFTANGTKAQRGKVVNPSLTSGHTELVAVRTETKAF